MTIRKPSIKYLFKDLLNEIKGSKYQITLKVLLSKYKKNAGKGFTSAYFNLTAKIVIGPKYGLDRQIFSRSF